MSAPRTTRAGRAAATLRPPPPRPRAVRWERDLLRLPPGAGRTLVAGGVIRAGVITYAIPRLPAAG
jgi:hypothetical protein